MMKLSLGVSAALLMLGGGKGPTTTAAGRHPQRQRQQHPAFFFAQQHRHRFPSFLGKNNHREREDHNNRRRNEYTSCARTTTTTAFAAAVSRQHEPQEEEDKDGNNAADDDEEEVAAGRASSPPSSSAGGGAVSLLSREEIARYSRHLVLSDVGVAGQVALKNSSVLVVGAGGLGSPCLLYLAAAGVGHLGIVDADVVDESNLQRQIIHGTSTVGLSKCESAARRIKDINPHVRVRLYQEELTSSTALRILGEGYEPGRPYDVVVDGSDNFPTKYLINDACSMLGLTWVYSAILAFEGQLSVFNFGGSSGPDYRDLLPSPPPPGDVPSCAEGGVLGVLPGTMGCLQATETIKLLLGRTADELLSGRVLVFNAMTMKFTHIGLRRRPDRGPINELIDYQGFCSGHQQQQQQARQHKRATTATTEASTGPGQRSMDEDLDNSDETTSDGNFHSLAPKECLDKLLDGWTPWVLDVRLQTENDIVALPFTDAVKPHRTVHAKHIPPAGDVLVYCKAGIRGKKACNRLVELGVESRRLYNLEGGILKWQEDVDPSMPRY